MRARARRSAGIVPLGNVVARLDDGHRPSLASEPSSKHRAGGAGSDDHDVVDIIGHGLVGPDDDARREPRLCRHDGRHAARSIGEDVVADRLGRRGATCLIEGGVQHDGGQPLGESRQIAQG